MRFYGLKSCDTCRKALKSLRAAGFDPQVIDVRADGLDAATIAAILDSFGEAALNRASATWRGLSEADRARPAADLLADHPTLLKRPVIVHDGAMTQGWKPDVQARYLGNPG